MKYIFTRDLPPTQWKKGDIEDRYLHTPAYAYILATWLALGYIEEYKEKEPDYYYRITSRMGTQRCLWTNSLKNRDHKECGNYYLTQSEADEALDRVKIALMS